MALNEVAAESVADGEGAFEVDEGAGGEVSERGEAEGLGEKVKADGGIEGDHGEAATIDGDGFAEGEFVGKGDIDGEACLVAAWSERDDGASSFDESGEHEVIF